MTKDDLISYHLQRMKRLQANRSQWEQRWQDVVDYLMPWKADIISVSTPGASKTGKIYDETPQYAQNILVSGLMGHLTSQQTPWFRLIPRDLELMEDPDVRDWLQDVTKTMITTLDGSNFYMSIEEFYQDLSGFGTAHMFQADDIKDIIRYFSFPVGEITVAEDSRGVVDTHYREYKDTLRQIAQEFGMEALSRDAQDAFANDPDKEIVCVHAVFPRESFDPRLLGGENMPWASLYFEKDTKHPLDEGGYADNPWHTARWYKGSRETYGRGPGINAMPAIKMLNAMAETNIQAGQKIVEPPLWVPSTLQGRLRTTPSAVNYYKPGGKGDEKPEPIITIGDVPFSLEMQQQQAEKVKYAFFVDVFLMLAGQTGQMTATEVVERVQERLMILGPALGRLHGEAFSPMLEREFSVLARGGHIPAPPEALREAVISIEYISPLAKALRNMESGAVTNAFGMAEPFLMLDPQSADVINSDEGVRRSFELHGAPTEMIRNEEEVQLIRQMRMKQAQAAALMEAMERGAGMEKTMAEAENARNR